MRNFNLLYLMVKEDAVFTTLFFFFLHPFLFFSLSLYSSVQVSYALTQLDSLWRCHTGMDHAASPSKSVKSSPSDTGDLIFQSNLWSVVVLAPVERAGKCLWVAADFYPNGIRRAEKL